MEFVIRPLRQQNSVMVFGKHRLLRNGANRTPTSLGLRSDTRISGSGIPPKEVESHPQLTIEDFR